MKKIYFLFLLTVTLFSNALNAQNVGIGESAPAAKFEIKGDSGSNLLNIKDQSNNSRLYILNNGNIGIGKTNPGFKLDVDGAIAFRSSGFDQYSLSASNSNFPELTYGGNPLNTSQVYRVTLATTGTGTNTGYVGFVWHNSDVPAWYVRHVSRASAGSNHPYLFVDGGIVKVRTDHPNNYGVAVTLSATASDDDDDPNIAGADYMWQRLGDALSYTDGNVGIGTSSPSFKLDVSGTGRFTGQLTVPLTPSAAAHAASKQYVDNLVGAVSETDPTWSGAANTTGDIGRTGNVGIGTNSPGAKVEIRGAGSSSDYPTTTSRGQVELWLTRNNQGLEFGTDGASNARRSWILARHSSESYGQYNSTLHIQPFVDGQASGTYKGVSIGYSPSANMSTNVYLQVAGETYLATAGGNVGIGLTNPTYKLHVNGRIRSNGINETSDERLKKNIEPLKNALETVGALQGVSYFWRVDEFPEMDLTSRKEIGVIAQEVEKVLPELVNTDKEGYKSVQYSHLVPVLIEAIKEQQSIIEQKDMEYRTMLDLQNQRIEKLETLLNVNKEENSTEILSFKKH